MSIPVYKKVSSIEAMVSSIETDAQVFRWFLFLISRPAIQSKFQGNNDVAALYNKLKKTISLQKIFYQTMFFFIILIAFLHQFFYFWLVIPFLYPCFKLYMTKKHLVAEISRNLISSDFKDTALSEKTLFQISELYSRKYHVPSLVDKMYRLDKISQTTIVITFLLANFVFSLTPFEVLLVVIAVYLVVHAISNANTVYKHLA